MKTSTIKNSLLIGTAIIALGAFTLPTVAQAADQTLTGPGTWASAGTAGGTDVGDASDAAAGDNIDVDTFLLTITDDGTAIDGGAAGTYTLGAVTDTDTGTAGTGSVLITTTAAQAPLTVTIGSASVAGDFDITNTNADNLDITVGVTGALTVGGNLTVINLEATTAADLALTVGGTTTVTGTTSITGGDVVGTSATANFDGNTAFTGAVTVLGGADAGGTADATFSGATNTFTGGLVLTDGVGAATATFDGAVAQTVTGVISGDGDITVTNTHASGVTFAGDSTNTGTLLVNNDGNNQRVVFTGDNASAIELGDGVTADTITANFSGTTQTISGGITGGAAETVNVNVLGGSTVTFTGAASSGIDTLAISGSTTLTTDEDLTATNTTVASGSTLATTLNTITSDIANAGTLALGGGDVTGDVSGAGAVDVTADATVTGDLGASTASVANATTLIVAGGAGNDVAVTTTTLTGTGALTVTAGSNITGNIVAATDGDGDVNILDAAATTAITGNIGTSAKKIATLDIGAGSGTVVTTTGNLYVNAIDLDDASTLTFNGGTTQVVSGTVNDGILTTAVAGTDVTFQSDITSAVSNTIAADTIARFNGNQTYSGAFTNSGTTHQAVDTVLTAGSIPTNTGTFNFSIGDAGATQGTLEADDVATIVSAGVVDFSTSTVNFNFNGAVATGTLADWATSSGAVTAGTLTDNSYLYDASLAVVGTDLDLTVAQANTIAGAASTSGNANVGAVLQSLETAGTTDTQILAILGNLNGASSADALNEVLESVGPTVDGGSVFAGFSASVQSLDISNTRLASLRDGDTQTGMTAGEMGNGATMWMQGFGQAAEQDRRDGIDGYDADTYGLAVGIDSANVMDQATVGVALSYANTDVDSKNANTTKTDVDSYQVSLYGDYDISEQTYLTGTLAYAWNDNEQTRHNVGGVSGLTAEGDFDSNQYIAYAEVGRDYAVANDTTFTPYVLAHYQHISIDDYTETGAGGANLNVNSDDLDIFELGLGAQVAWDLDGANGSKMRPALSVGYRHDLIGDAVDTTSTLAGGGAAFETSGLEPAQGTFDAGASISYAMDNNWEFTADYSYEVKSDYSAHTGSLRAGYKF